MPKISGEIAADQTGQPTPPARRRGRDVRRRDAAQRAARRLADRSRARRGRRLPRPGQRREQHDRRRPVRLPAGVGRRARQRHGVAHPVPVGEARDRHRPSLPETLGRRIRNRVGPARVLAAGRARRDGHRHRRGDRRRGRAQPAVRHAAAVGRRHHRHRLDRAARGAVAARPAHLRVRRHRAASRSSRSASRSACSSPRPTRRGVARRAGAALRGHRIGAAGGIHPRRDDHAARDLRAQRARPRPVRTDAASRRAVRRSTPRPPGTASAPGDARMPLPSSCAASRPPYHRTLAARHEVGRLDRDAHRRHREPLHPAARGREPRRRRGHRHASRAPTRRSARASARSSRRCSRSGCSPAASPRRRSAPTPAPRSCTACCTCACRSSPAGSSR